MKRNYFNGLLAALTLFGLGTSQAWADKIVTSTAENPKWFRIYTPNRSNLSLISKGVGVAMQNTTTFEKPYSASQLWRLEAGSTDGTYKIVNMSGEYISPSSTVKPNNNTAFAPVKSGAGDWTITDLSDDTYTITSGSVQFNTSQDGPNYYLYNWGSGTNKEDAGCKYRFEAVSLTELETAQAKALSVLNETEEGTNPGQYPAEVRTTFTNAIKAATTVDAITAAQTAYSAAMVQVAAGKTYYIVSDKSVGYCQGKYIYSAGSEAQPKWGNKVVSAAYGWTFTDAGNGQFYVQNYGTKEYIEPNSNGVNGATKTTATPATKYTVTSLGQGVFNIKPDGKNPLHAQNDNKVLVMWAGGIGSASAWRLIEIPESDLTATPTFNSINVAPGFQTYAAGNKEQVLLTFQTEVAGFNGNVVGKSLKLNLGATNVAGLENIKVFTSKNANFVSNGQRDATLIGQVATVSGNEVEVAFDNALEMPSGTTRFYVTADITDKAVVGDSVDAALVSFTYGDNMVFTVNNGNPEGIARVYKVQSVPFMPNDLGSPYWRIPSMVVLHNQKGANASKNGRVITMADNRFNHNADLPNHIDVYERHSDDNGKTWSDHKWVVGNPTDEALVAGKDGSHKGFGDVTMVETASGKIIALMAGGQGYFYSSNEDGNRIVPVIITSTDGGDTWSQARALTDELYKGVYEQGQVLGSFAGSGRGICLQRQKDAKLNGRVMFAMSHRFATGAIQEYIIYSDDEGETWKMSPKSAYNGGEESKLVELADGTVMISVRRSGQRGFNTSTDGGMTWGTQTTNADINGNACNADILYYNNKVLLHSYVNNGSRKNVTVKASFDNGKTWGHPVVICAPSSCYSTMDITKDGDIAIFYEDNACTQGYALNYAVFPIDWIVPGGDPSAEVFQEALAKAKAATTNEGYTDEATAKAGQYSQEAIDNVKSLIATYEASVTDYEAATAALNAAVEAMGKTACTVDGYYNETTFTISSLSTISSLEGAGYISADAKAKSEADNTAEWQIVPATVAGQVYIKLKDADTYIFRSGNTLAASAAPQAWKLVKNDGFYNLIAVHKAENSYLVINVGTGEFNWWTSAAGSDTWSTKFVLTAKTVVTDINNATVANGSEKAVRYYDLQGRRVLNPTKGPFITNMGKKVIK